MKRLLLVLILSTFAVPAYAQAADTLRSVTFAASPDQTATMADGTAILQRYELTIDRLANPTAVPPVTAAVGLAVLNLGKPVPVSNVITVLNVVVPVTLTGGDYVARVASVGPGGRSADLSGPFSQPLVPRPVTGLTVVR